MNFSSSFWSHSEIVLGIMLTSMIDECVKALGLEPVSQLTVRNFGSMELALNKYQKIGVSFN